MKTNEVKKLTPLQAADLPTGAYRAGFRIKAEIPGVIRRSVGRRRILGAEKPCQVYNKQAPELW